MNILHVGIFEDHALGGDIIFRKGLELNGVNVEPFDYRAITEELGIKGMRAALMERARGKDLLFIGKGELLDKDCLHTIRRAGTQVALWYGEPPHLKAFSWLADLLPEVDFLFSSTSGNIVKQYEKISPNTLVSYYVNPVDPDLVKDLPPVAKAYDIVFTGTKHKDLPGLKSEERQQTIDYLLSRKDVTFFGNAHIQGINRWLTKLGLKKKPRKIRGQEYVQAIRQARIGVGVNTIQNQPRYTSDRLQHYLMFGTFFMPWHFPELERLFQLDKEIVPFYDIEDLTKKLDYFLAHDSEREEIARAGQARILRDYNTQKVTRMMLDIMDKGHSDLYPWLAEQG